MIDALKIVGALLCGAGLLFLIYVESDEQRSRDFTNWIDQHYSSGGVIDSGQSASGPCPSMGEGLRCILPAIKEGLPYLSIISSLVAAGLGIRAATILVRDSMDHFIADLQRQGRWAGWAAAMAALSVMFQAADRLAQ